MRFAAELRRRRVFTTAGLYVVGAWLVMQAADVFFPGWGIPDTGINVLLGAAVIGFPLALVFGWFFNITAHGIRRTMPEATGGTAEPRPLKRIDYFVLAVLVSFAGVIVYFATSTILTLPGTDAADVEAQTVLTPVEKLPNSIAVLPFENISTDPDNEVFSDGVSEEIRNRLGQHGELQVIARTSSLQFKDSEFGLAKISDLLGVRYLVRGSVRAHGDRIRVSAQLVADKGKQLWSKNYDRVLTDIFVIQDEIADLVATEVAPHVVASSRDSYEPSLDAYKHFVAGRDLIYRRDALRARKELAQAIELDPDFAEAHAEYAISLLYAHPDKKAIRDADTAIDTALRLAPDLPRALAARGFFFNRAQTPPDPVAAEAVLREALRGDPNMVYAMNWLAHALHLQGRHDEADQWLERAYALDPFDGLIASNRAFQVWERGNPDRSEQILRRLVELPEPPLTAIFSLAEFYTDTGRLVEANRTAKRLMLTNDRLPLWLAGNYAMMSQFQTAATLISGTVREYPDETWIKSGWIQAQVPHWRGDYTQAVALTRQIRAANGVSPGQLSLADRLFDGINQALAGENEAAIDKLTAALRSAGDSCTPGGLCDASAHQALAWACSRAGLPDMARQRLEAVEQWFIQRRDSVETMQSGELYGAALNAALMNDWNLALDRLEQAVEAGWRAYYVSNNDPRWGLLRDDARFHGLMAQVKADVDRQRAIVEKIDAEEDFQALLDEIRDNRRSATGQDAGQR